MHALFESNSHSYRFLSLVCKLKKIARKESMERVSSAAALARIYGPPPIEEEEIRTYPCSEGSSTLVAHVPNYYTAPGEEVYGLHENPVHSRVRPPAFSSYGATYDPPKQLDSRFIEHVNIRDGTTMAPLTPFTKIWRLRNNGLLMWPKGSQFVWDGGDKLGNVRSVTMQSALPVDMEREVAVDFVAPERAGRYVSYWITASPSGHKFGQRVWVVINVVDDSTQGI